MNSLLSFATKYVFDLGWSIIPTDVQTKAPIISWLEYQKRLPTEDELNLWFGKADSEKVGLGLVTGKLSNIIVVDDDFRNGKVNVDLDSPLKVITGGGGVHLYFKYTEGITNKAHVDNKPVDIRGEGGLVILPPSKHKSGNEYKWDFSGYSKLSDAVKSLTELPHVFTEKHNQKEPLQIATVIGTPEGGRNDKLFRFASKLVDHTTPDDLWSSLLAMNQTFQPPLSEREVRYIFNSALKFKQPEPRINIRTWDDVIKNRMEQKELEAIAPKTGYSKLDELIGGFLPGHTYILSGLTNAGKTAMAANFTERLRQQGKRVLYIALEPREGIVDYLASVRTEKPFRALLPEDYKQNDNLIDIITRIEKIEHLEKTLEETGSNYHLVIIDHAGYFFAQAKDILQEQMRLIKKLIDIAWKFKFAIMPIAHMRKGMGGVNRILSMDDIMGSAALSQDSSEVILIQRYLANPEDKEDPRLKNEAKLVVTKTKKGAPGFVPVYFYTDTAVVKQDDEVFEIPSW